MKVYKFFKKPNDELKKYPDDEFSLSQKYPLYGITTDKKIAKIFRKTRNMNLFIEKVDDVDKSIIDDVITSKRSKLIEYMEITSYINKFKVNQKQQNVKIVMTESEYQLVTEYSDTGQILNIIKTWLPIDIFSKDVADALRSIYYDKIYDFVNNINLYEETYIDIPIVFDEFAIFIYIYSDTFSLDFFDYVIVNKN